MINITSQIPEPLGLTNSCYEWCVEQHYVHAFSNFQLLTSATGILLFSMFVFWYGTKTKKGKVIGLGVFLILIGIAEIVAFIVLETQK